MFKGWFQWREIDAQAIPNQARSADNNFVLGWLSCGIHWRVRIPLASSQGKAFTASSMGRPTTELASMIAEKPFLDGLKDMDPRLVILGSGLAVIIDDSHLGGIGVGGAPGGHLDKACTRAGLDAIGRNP